MNSVLPVIMVTVTSMFHGCGRQKDGQTGVQARECLSLCLTMISINPTVVAMMKTNGSPSYVVAEIHIAVIKL